MPWSADGDVPAAVVQSTRLFRERLLDDPYRPQPRLDRDLNDGERDAGSHRPDSIRIPDRAKRVSASLQEAAGSMLTF